MSSYSLINIIIFSDNMFDYENIKQKLVSMTYSIYEGDNLLENVDTPVSFIFGQETNLLPIVESKLEGKEKDSDDIYRG